ncbi:MAG: L,D-transpeptidase [Clostridia bacterium]|nr:L,D-transpeptidase [Clostridia bacterium]
MFKHLRRIAVLTLCLTMMLTACTAFAAVKLKLTVPSKEVRGADEYTITVNTDEPGFLTMNLTQNGKHIAALVKNHEIHTKDNEVTLTALDDNGAPIAPGTYTVTAVLVDQFGVSCAEASKDMQFKEPKVEEETTESKDSKNDASNSSSKKNTESASSKKSTESESSKKNTESESSKKNTESESSKKASAKPTATPKPTNMLVYESGKAVVGAEGYEIGVGVSDADKTAKGYWALSSDSTDEEIWAAMQETMTVCTVGENENAYIYNSTAENRKRLGTISGTSQGLNVIYETGKWTLVEAFRVEDGAFVRGYIRSNTLRTVEPNPTYGLLIDKNTQTLIVYKDGKRIGSTPISTGLPTAKYLHRETPAGEYITVTRRGTLEYYGSGNFCKYTIRVGGSYHLSEIPTTKKNGSDYSVLVDSLGKKATRGNIVVAHDASTDGGINAEWIWNLTDENKRVKVLILDDKNRDSVPVGSK